MKKVEENLSAGKIAKRAGIAKSVLHFYDKKGLIESGRTLGGHRVFCRSILRTISLIRIGQKLGFSLDKIREVTLKQPSKKELTIEEWQETIKEYQDEIEVKIKDLTLIRDQLNTCIGCGCLGLPMCKILNPDDSLAELGDGPRLINL